ncbi:MAG: hypothetical protein WC342_00255 [Methanoregula sp.]|jgi:hypothetical protein
MSKYFGYKPKPQVKSAVETFEATTQVKSNNGILLGSVYVDVQEKEWAVAFAYGVAQHPKLRGPEPVYEVRYSVSPEEKTKTLRADTRSETKSTVQADPFPDVDAFVLWALHTEQGNTGAAST